MTKTCGFGLLISGLEIAIGDREAWIEEIRTEESREHRIFHVRIMFVDLSEGDDREEVSIDFSFGEHDSRLADASKIQDVIRGIIKSVDALAATLRGHEVERASGGEA